MNKENLANAFIDGSLSAIATSVDLKAGYATYQPTTPYFATITPFGELSTKANSEIVEVTNISGSTLTIVRGQRGTTAKSFSDGAIFSNGIYVEDLEAKLDKAGDTMTGRLVMPSTEINGVLYLSGTGFPNGVVSAPVGSIYIDKNITNGASSWVKKSGTGNTGWQVLEGDTGWRRMDLLLVSGGYMYLRRIGSTVTVALGGGTFDSIQYATDAPINSRRRIVAVDGVPVGFRFSRAQPSILTSNSEAIVGVVYYSGAADANFIELRNSLRAVTTAEFMRPQPAVFQTSEVWPISLPGVSA